MSERTQRIIDILTDYVTTDKWKYDAPAIGRDYCLDIIGALVYQEYKDNWINLKEEIVKLQKDYKNGAMMSLEESIQGNRTCELILRTMNDIETKSNSVVDVYRQSI